MGEAKQEPARSRNEGARRRLAKATRKRQPTREEELDAEIKRLQAMRGRSHQQQAELDWLLTVRELDELKAGVAIASARLGALRRARNEAIDRKAGLELRLQLILDEEPEKVLGKALESADLFAQMSAVNAAVATLKNRVNEEESAQRDRSAQVKQLQMRVMALKARTGIPG